MRVYVVPLYFDRIKIYSGQTLSKKARPDSRTENPSYLDLVLILLTSNIYERPF